MNKIIGGLLVLSMLSRPGILKIDFLAYEMYKSNASIINYLKKVDTNEADYNKEDIDMIMSDLDSNKRYITELIEMKKDSINQIDNILKEKSAKKVFLTEEQINKFSSFSKSYSEKSEFVKNHIDYVSNSDFNDIQKQVLHENVDYRYIYEKFDTITKNQNEIIGFLTGIIDDAQDTINVLC